MKGKDKCDIRGYPSKSIELKSSGGFIFRSDSNSEDLAGFAGAGLFDSYALEEEQALRVSYSEDLLIQDKAFCDKFMRSVGSIGELIEQMYGGVAQDIEGVYSEDGKFYVVQTRP